MSWPSLGRKTILACRHTLQVESFSVNTCCFLVVFLIFVGKLVNLGGKMAYSE